MAVWRAARSFPRPLKYCKFKSLPEHVRISAVRWELELEPQRSFKRTVQTEHLKKPVGVSATGG
jgi:hypothetical protein